MLKQYFIRAVVMMNGVLGLPEKHTRMATVQTAQSGVSVRASVLKGEFRRVYYSVIPACSREYTLVLYRKYSPHTLLTTRQLEALG